MTRLFRLFLAAVIAVAFGVPAQQVYAAATLQTTHAVLCAPQKSGTTVGPRRVVNTSSTASPQPAYNLNAQGCALIAGADIGFFVSQGYTAGPAHFVLQQRAITATTTGSTSTITLPAYGLITAVVLSETAGNAITGGVDIGDAGSATRFASAVALGANATVAVADSALTRLYVPSGVPTADQILVACHTSCNSGSINITVIYTYF